MSEANQPQLVDDATGREMYFENNPTIPVLYAGDLIRVDWPVKGGKLPVYLRLADAERVANHMLLVCAEAKRKGGEP